MTRSTPERRRLARLMGAMLLVLPLLASAAVFPDAAPAQPLPSPPEAPLPPPAPEATPLAPEAAPASPDAAPASPEVPDATEALPPPPPPAASYASADTLIQYMAERQVWNRDGNLRVQLQLKSNATYEIAEAIANYYSDGDEEGELMIVGNGFRIERSTLRADALPPPPPPPPPPASPEAPQAPPPPPPTPSDADLARYADALSSDLAEAQQAMKELSEQQKDERSEQYMRLKIRLDTVRQEQQRLIEEQERRRLDAMKREALGGEYH